LTNFELTNHYDALQVVHINKFKANRFKLIWNNIFKFKTAFIS
jgi:hypothetical protein